MLKNNLKELKELKTNLNKNREQREYFDDNGKRMNNIEFGNFT